MHVDCIKIMNEQVRYKIINDDALKILKELPDKSIDLLLTDPPYGISKNNRFASMGRSSLDFGEWDKDFNQLEWLKEIPRILTKNGSVVIFNAWKNLGDIARFLEGTGKLEIKDMIRWEKTNPMPRNRDRRYITDYECAIWLVKKGAKWTFNRQSETYERPKIECGIVQGKIKAHPTQKPVYLLEKLIAIHSNANDVVLDCFMGSGSTGEACIKNNRKFIGVELDGNYFDIAKARLDGVCRGAEQ